MWAMCIIFTHSSSCRNARLLTPFFCIALVCFSSTILPLKTVTRSKPRLMEKSASWTLSTLLAKRFVFLFKRFVIPADPCHLPWIFSLHLIFCRNTLPCETTTWWMAKLSCSSIQLLNARVLMNSHLSANKFCVSRILTKSQWFFVATSAIWKDNALSQRLKVKSWQKNGKFPSMRPLQVRLSFHVFFFHLNVVGPSEFHHFLFVWLCREANRRWRIFLHRCSRMPQVD